MTNKITVYDVPTEAGAHFHGQCRAPSAFKEARFQELLASAGYSVDTQNVLDNTPVLWQPSALRNGIRNEGPSIEVLQKVQGFLKSHSAFADANTFSVVIGGDCSITAATVSALTHKYPSKRIGIMYVDNDVDLTIPSETTQTGATGILDSMTMSTLTLRPGSLPSMRQFSRPDGSPLVTPENIVVFGLDLGQPRLAHFGYLLDNHFRVFTSPSVRDAPLECAKDALAWLEQRVDMIFVHFDVDVIDSGEFPLGNFPSYGGIGFEGVMSAIRCFLASEKVVGLSVTEVNPNNDPDGTMVGRLVQGLAKGFEEKKSKRAGMS